MIRKQMFFYLLLVAVLASPGPALAALSSSYWTVNSLTPASGQSYASGTQQTYVLSLKTKLVGTTCTIATSTSLTSSPWAVTPTWTSRAWAFQGTNTIEANVTVGVGTSTITFTLSGCSGGGGYNGTYTFTVTGTAPSNYVKITGITETISGNFQTMGGTTNESISSGNLTACVYTSASNGNYYLRIDGASDSGGVFYLVKGTDKFPVTITWNSTTLTPGTDVLFSGGSSSETCGGSTNATMVISASSAEVLKVPGSATQYLDNFVITVTHPDEI